MLILNNGQAEVVSNLIEFYNHPTQMIYVLNGHAGTGKSTSIQEGIKQIRQQSAQLIKVCMTAPTNKATKVLRQMAFDQGLQVDTATIYSILGLVLTSNNEIRRTAKMLDGRFSDYDIVVLDEVSMCGTQLWDMVVEESHNQRVKVIAMGDKCQLPPVLESNPKVFENNTYWHGHLTEIMRQTEGNPMIPLLQKIRDAQVDSRIKIAYEDSFSPEGIGMYVVGQLEWIETIKANFTSDEYKENPNAFRCLAYTNRRVNNLNKMIRRLLVGDTDEPFIVGERVLVRKPIKDETGKPAIHTDEECTVKRVLQTMHPLFKDSGTQYKVWELYLVSDTGVHCSCFLLHNDSRSDFKETLDSLGKIAKKDNSRWKDFWSFKDAFDELQSPHAMTVHRSQGSTYNNVFIDMADIYKNRNRLERLQLEYVACSRASETLIIAKGK